MEVLLQELRSPGCHLSSAPTDRCRGRDLLVHLAGIKRACHSLWGVSCWPASGAEEGLSTTVGSPSPPWSGAEGSGKRRSLVQSWPKPNAEEFTKRRGRSRGEQAGKDCERRESCEWD